MDGADCSLLLLILLLLLTILLLLSISLLLMNILLILLLLSSLITLWGHEYGRRRLFVTITNTIIVTNHITIIIDIITTNKHY